MQSWLCSACDLLYKTEDRTFRRLHIRYGLTPRHYSWWRERRPSSFYGYLERGGDIARPERESRSGHPSAAGVTVAVREHQHPCVVRCDRHRLVLPKEGESEILVVISRPQAGHAAVEFDRRGHVVRVDHSSREL